MGFAYTGWSAEPLWEERGTQTVVGANRARKEEMARTAGTGLVEGSEGFVCEIILDLKKKESARP
jgi:hypothetical protein